MSDSSSESNAPAEKELHVPMRTVVGFVRQFSHDLRNHLNAAELQSAFLSDLAETPELKSELQRLRGMLSEMGGSLQRLTSSLAAIKLTPIPYEADAFLQDLEQKVALEFPEQSGAIDWQENVGNRTLKIDPQILQQAFLELFANAFQHDPGFGRLTAKADAEGWRIRFHLARTEKGFCMPRPRIGAANLSAGLAMGIMVLACTARAISLRPTADACRRIMINHPRLSPRYRRWLLPMLAANGPMRSRQASPSAESQVPDSHHDCGQSSNPDH